MAIKDLMQKTEGGGGGGGGGEGGPLAIGQILGGGGGGPLQLAKYLGGTLCTVSASE